jgi:hypothetical protein
MGVQPSPESQPTGVVFGGQCEVHTGQRRLDDGSLPPYSDPGRPPDATTVAVSCPRLRPERAAGRVDENLGRNDE